jgi:3-dehydroquinate dehydratase-2
MVLNGPNLGRLGVREPEKYGSVSYAELVRRCEQAAGDRGVGVDVRQTDHEGELVGWLHEAADGGHPVILNAAAWTHYSVAVRDAAAQLTAPWIELHITNVHARESFRATSVLSDIATAVVAGLGIDGYVLALHWLADH